MKRHEIPTELKRSFLIAEWSPLFWCFNVFFVLILGGCVAMTGVTGGIAGFFGAEKGFGWNESLMTILFGSVIFVVSYFLMNWLDGVYFKNLALVSRFGRDNTPNGIELWLKTQRFAETRGYGYLFQD